MFDPAVYVETDRRDRRSGQQPDDAADFDQRRHSRELAACSLISGFLAGRFAATASCSCENLRRDLFYKVQGFSFGDVDKFSSSSLVTRLTTDVTNVQNAFQMCIRIAFRVPLMFIFRLS
ncbi:MAG: ABC transporter transmembrane domain-containing protein [Christensenellaceae bacterium]